MSIEKSKPHKRENIIRRVPKTNLFSVYNRKTGQVHSLHTTLTNATAQRRLIEAVQHNRNFLVYK